MMRRSAIVCSGWAAAPQVRQKSGEDYPEVPPRAHDYLSGVKKMAQFDLGQCWMPRWE
jgi:hypothetical protein